MSVPPPPPNQVPPAAPKANVPAPSACAPGLAQVIELTPVQIDRTLATLAPKVPGVASALSVTFAGGSTFSNDSTPRRMVGPHVRALFDELSGWVQAALSQDPVWPAACVRQAQPADACVSDTVESFLTRAFRRKPTPEEKGRYLALYAAQRTKHGGGVALSAVLRAALTSPWFLYRTELGAEGSGPSRLTNDEIASALAFGIGNGPPDVELSMAANTGALATAAGVRAQARRLLAQPSTAGGLLRFWSELLRHDAVVNAVKDHQRYPALTTELRRDLVQETDRFIQHVLWQEDARWQTLISSEFTLANERVARFHGLTGVTGTMFQKVPTPGRRAGLLTHASLLATLSGEVEANMIMRGGFIRREILCGQVPDPPGDLVVAPIKDDGKRTNREQYAQHSADPKCAGCHSLLDPLGAPLETFDAAGQLRTTQNGRAIDPSGRISGTRSSDGPVTDAFDLAAKLGTSADARTCAAKHLHQYMLARPPSDADACALKALAMEPAVAAGDLRETVAAIYAQDSFLFRQETSQ